jgi:hypothetical protein
MPDPYDVTIDAEYLGHVVDMEISNADSWMDSDLSEEQEDNLDAYYGRKYGNEEKGFSQVVTRDVLETVEGILPDLMKIFTSGDQVVEFDPIGPNDEERVEIQGRYINHVFMNRFNGYQLLYEWFKDSLLMKNGIIKTGWIKAEEIQFKEYEDLTKEEYDSLVDGAEKGDDEDLLGTYYEIDKTEKEKEKGVVTYDARIKIVRERGRPDVLTIPSEEFRIKQRSKSIKDAPFVAHVTTKTRGELLELGFDEDDIQDSGIVSQSEQASTGVPNARFQKPNESPYPQQLEGASDYEHEIRYAEAYVRLYDPEDERVKLYSCVMLGNKCVEYEEVARVPFISLAPISMPHKFTGVAIADLVKDIQAIRTTIYRQMLDNLALQNAGRYTAVEGQVNLQDLIDNRIGGIVRQKMPGAVQRLDTPDLSAFTVPVLELLDLQKENRTGVSRMTAGLDQSALSSHQTASAVNQVMTAAQGKILLIARNFAETGVKELFLELYNLIRENQTKPDLVPISGRYAVVNPPEWTDRYDVHVTVGIGNGNKDQQLFHLKQIQEMLGGLVGSEYGYMITDQNVFNLASEFIKNSGYLNPAKFISNPQTVQKPEPKPSPDEIVAQARAKEVDNSGKKDVADTQLDGAKFQWQKKIDAVEAGLESEQNRPVGLGDGK